jgi:hypothetical protein
MDTITFAQIGHVALLWTGVSLFGWVTTQILKTPLRIAWKRRAALKGDSRALYNWTIRTIPVGFCTLASTQMGVWPLWISDAWKIMLGAAAGAFSVVVYHALKTAIPKAIAILPEAVKKRLGG